MHAVTSSSPSLGLPERYDPRRAPFGHHPRDPHCTFLHYEEAKDPIKPDFSETCGYSLIQRGPHSIPVGATMKRSNLRAFLSGNAVAWHRCGTDSAGLDGILGCRDGTRYRVSEERVDTSRRVLVETLNRVQINARCDRRRFMSKGARDGLQVDARCERERPERMAQIVESDVRKLRAFDEPGKRKRERARLPRRAVCTRKDPVASVWFYPARLAQFPDRGALRGGSSATNGGSAIVRALRAVFGGLVRVTPLTVSSER